MPPTDKPMPELLTRAQVKELNDGFKELMGRDNSVWLTIEAFAELLERTNKWLGRLAFRLEGLPTTQEEHELLLALDATLRSYHGTGTSEQEGGGA